VTDNPNFIDLIGSLAKSSAQAVSTESKHEVSKFTDLKEYLYIQTKVEDALLLALENTSDKQIIFLCGSSGDGKSEILNRHSQKYEENFNFHLDATHSFQPNQNAIEALDDVFSEYKSNSVSLVVGINAGMLMNYEGDGHDDHTDIQSAISAYLNDKAITTGFCFINFEDYPKFEYENGSFKSSFIEELLDKITDASEENPIYKAFLDCKESLSLHHQANFLLLSNPFVKKRIVEVLLKARLKYDQFLTTRAILDFIHHLIAGPDYLFDNLFVKGRNELVNVLSNFDPCNIRTRELDEFLIQTALRIESDEFSSFKSSYEETYLIQNINPGSWIRALYVLGGSNLGNNFHHKFENDFSNDLFTRYSQIWNLHTALTSDPSIRKEINSFYNKEFVNALLKFANRLAPYLSKDDRIFIAKRGEAIISSKVELLPYLAEIPKVQNHDIDSFQVVLNVDDEAIEPFSVNINFLELLEKIRSGYRPNVHDKNSVALLETVLGHIQKVANKNSSIHVDFPGGAASITHKKSQGLFVVRGDY